MCEEPGMHSDKASPPVHSKGLVRFAAFPLLGRLGRLGRSWIRFPALDVAATFARLAVVAARCFAFRCCRYNHNQFWLHSDAIHGDGLVRGRERIDRACNLFEVRGRNRVRVELNNDFDEVSFDGCDCTDRGCLAR